MNRVKLGWLGAVVTLLVACGSPSESTIGSNPDVTENRGDGARPADVVLAIGEENAVAGTNLRIRFDAVRSDSRCPIDALCIHPGDAEVQITLSVGSARSQPVLHWNVGPDRPASATLSGYRVTLKMLDPMPSSRTGTPAPTAYRAHLNVQRI